MESFWNSYDVINIIRLIAQWSVAICGIIALVFSMRATTLKSRSDAEHSKADSTEIARLHAKSDSASYPSTLPRHDPI